PLVMGLLAWVWEEDLSPGRRRALLLVLAMQIVGQSLPLLPGCETLKDAGLALYAALTLWLAGCVVLYCGREFSPPNIPNATPARITGHLPAVLPGRDEWGFPCSQQSRAPMQDSPLKIVK